jgi:hypothetical protein
MTADRAELAGTGAAIAFHVALIAALSLNLARVDEVSEPPSMEVELVDEVGLTAAAPTSIAVPPPASQAPEIGEAEPNEPAPAPILTPAPVPPRIVAAPSPRPTLRAIARPAPPKPAPHVSRIGDDFLKGIDEAPGKAPAKPAAATFSAAAKADIASAIARQIEPCAQRQRALGPGANRIRVVLNLRLFLNGRLKGTPTVVRTSGVDDDNAQYEELVVDQAIASYRQCAPLRLPAELYQTPQGGWSNINMTYRVP